MLMPTSLCHLGHASIIHEPPVKSGGERLSTAAPGELLCNQNYIGWLSKDEYSTGCSTAYTRDR